MNRTVVVAALGTAQTLAWASSYYLPAILADPIAQGTGVSRTVVFGLFSGALLLSAFFGPAVGRAIDQRGGRGMLAISNLVLAAGLVLLALSHEIIMLTAAWTVLGVGMAMGLYEPAFATLTGLYGRAARGPITGITLIAGFASTVGWPLSAFLEAQYGWREACLIWAALHIVIGLPLNRLLIPPAPPPRAIEAGGRSAAGPTLGDADPCLCLRHNRVCDRRHGGASAASARRLPAQARRWRSRLRLWLARRKSARASLNLAPCAWCIRSSPHGSQRSCIRSVRRHSLCLVRVP